MNFTDLPCEIKATIYKMNRDAERDEMYKDAYDDLVGTFNLIMFSHFRGYVPRVRDIVEMEP